MSSLNIFDFKTYPLFDLANPDHVDYFQPISQTTQITYNLATHVLTFTHQNSEELGGIKLFLATIPGEVYQICVTGQLIIGDTVLLSIENTCMTNFRLYNPVYFSSTTSEAPQTFHICFQALDDTTVIYFQTDPQGGCCQKAYQFDLSCLQIAPQPRLLPGIPLVTGFIGSQGPQGPLGPSGALIFPNAPEGPQGPQGAQGPIIPSPQGPTGPPAPPEILNTPGPQGPKGPLGPPDPATPQGPTGLSGEETGPQGPEGPQGAKGPQGVIGIPGLSYIDPVPSTELANLTWITSTGVTLVPASPSIRYEMYAPNEVIIHWPEFSFNQNIDPNPYFIEAFLPLEIRPSITYTQPILVENGGTPTMAQMRFGPNQVAIYGGLDPSTDLFMSNQTHVILPQSFRYLV